MMIDEVLDDAQKRLQRLGAQELQIFITNLHALAKQHSLLVHTIGFNHQSLRISPESFGYGEEPTVNVLSPIKPGVVGKGATVIYPPDLGGTSLPAHDYQIARFITPNIIVPPPAAALLFSQDKVVSQSLADLRGALVSNLRESILRAKTTVYGSANVIPIDVVGSMTILGQPELRVWRNLPRDLLVFRIDAYLGLTIIPGRAVAAEPGDAGADTPAPNSGASHDNPSAN